ncbi:MAG: OB-fold putative lipoprotein [Lachnospiraceae bacterium]|nr:OB-fold putative lipoprotein [Lachnospiraceae bacterium]
MREKGRRKTISIALLLILGVILCGAGFSKNDPKLIPERRPVYQREDLTLLCGEFRKSPSEAERLYGGHEIVTEGILKEKKGDGTSFILSDGTELIPVSGARKTDLMKIDPGENVYVYGVLRTDPEKKALFLIGATHVIKGSRSGLRDDHYIYKGKSWSSKNTTEETLLDGKIRYRIPASWKGVELPEEEKDRILNIDHAEGTGYVLNGLKGKDQAECFFIFWFSFEKYLKNGSDRSEIPGVERAIITNICPDENLSWYNSTAHYSFPTRSETASYGRTFDHYVAVYGTHRVEYVFTPMMDGLCVLMYVYNGDDSSVDDILYVMRTLEAS